MRWRCSPSTASIRRRPCARISRRARRRLEETPKPGDPRLARVETIVVATPQRSLEAAAAVARKRGLEVVMLGDNLEGEARELGALHAQKAIEHARRAGKPTGDPVRRRDHGHGARQGPRRAQRRIPSGQGHRANGAPGIWGLAADTDGVDGAEDIAGGMFTPEFARPRPRHGP